MCHSIFWGGVGSVGVNTAIYAYPVSQSAMQTTQNAEAPTCDTNYDMLMCWAFTSDWKPCGNSTKSAVVAAVSH